MCEISFRRILPLGGEREYQRAPISYPAVLRRAADRLGQACVWIVLLGSLAGARAERLLTVEEAQKICFPEANQFQSQKLSLSSAEKKRVENQSRVKVRRSAVQLWWARRGTNLLGVLFVDQVLGKHEWIDYALAVTPDGRVAHVEILEYREHYGGQVTNAPWRQQFRGKSAASPLKLNDDISNITGATLSCRHVTEGVKRLLATFEVVVRPHGPVGRGVPDAGPIAKP